MTTRELLNYAEHNGYNSVMFAVKKDGKHVVTGKFLDAYYEFIQIPVMGDGFVRISALEQQLGYDISFDIINSETEFYEGIFLDYIIRGKVVPDEVFKKINN